jgi:hypothetical protein
VRIVRRWPRAVAILGNVPGAVVLASAIDSAWKVPSGPDPGSSAGWSLVLGLGLVSAALIGVAFVLFLLRLAWLPLAAVDAGLAFICFVVGIGGLVQRLVYGDLGELNVREGTAMVGSTAIGIGYLIALGAVRVDRSTLRRVIVPTVA